MAHEAMETEEARQGQVTEQLENLEKAIEHLTRQIDRLGGRLKPVLRDVDEGEKKAAEMMELVPLADSVRRQVHRVNGQATRLIDILGRLEL